MYSRPKRIISDRGTCFTSEEFKKNVSGANIGHVLVSVASPQSNGQVERVNHVLKSMLSKLTEPLDHGDWVKQLKHVEFAMNNTVHFSTKQTPSKLLLGIEQLGEIVDELSEYLHEVYTNDKSEFNEIRVNAQRAIQKSHLYNKKYFEKHHRPARQFKEGDSVVIKHVDTTVGRNKKLNIKYRGPYVFRKQLGHYRYEITDVEYCQLTQMPYENVIDSNRMKLWLENSQGMEEMDTEGNTDDDNEDKNYEGLGDSNDYVNYEYLDET